jgi:hypothetical protein
MAESGNFNRLASKLSLEERLDLLEKLKGQSNISTDPLYHEEEDKGPVLDIEIRYARLPWYYRLWYVILSLVKAQSSIKLFEDRQMAMIGRAIENQTPGLYDFQKAMLLPSFFDQLKSLKNTARFFYTALDAGANQDKGAFYAFLGSLEMGPVHQRLQSETDPNIIGEEHPEASETEIRQMAFHSTENIMKEITEDFRRAMYFNVRSLHCLKELAFFPFDRVMMAFAFDSAANGQICSATAVKDLLTNLNNILSSLKVIPPMPLLESLFIFLLQEQVNEPGFDFDKEIRILLLRASEALSAVRTFNKQVPLTAMLRCATRNMALAPKEISGGEDWFVVYREYWKRQVEILFADYARNRRRQELLESFRYFLKGTNLKILDGILSEANPAGMPVKGGLALSFLLTFYSEVFMADINKTLKLILIDGDFYKKENRAEFTESYNNLVQLEDNIKKFEQSISPSGNLGQRYILAKQDISSLQTKGRKIQIVLEEASDWALNIMEQTRRACKSMANTLNEILEKDVKRKYNTLTNISKLSGKSPRFVTDIGKAVQQFQKVLQLLDDIDATEAAR